MNWIGLWTLVRQEIDRTLRVAIQTLVTPWISALLYIFIFGSVIGSRIELIAGVKYIDFVLPGILMMSVMTSAFMHGSSSLYFARFIRTIEEMLVAPFSHIEMISGYVIGAVARALIVGVGILIIAVFFSAANFAHVGLFLFYIILVSIVFSLLGILVGLWAKSFEQLNVLNTFFIMPFSFLGGMFYSVHMLPEKIQLLAYANPFFYFIDGIRYSMIGVKESNHTIGFILIISLALFLGVVTTFLFRRGWRIRV